MKQEGKTFWEKWNKNLEKWINWKVIKTERNNIENNGPWEDFKGIWNKTVEEKISIDREKELYEFVLPLFLQKPLSKMATKKKRAS